MARTYGGSSSRCARQHWRASCARAATGLRLNEHMEHPEGDVVFRHACKMGLEGIVSEIALQVWAVAGLAQVQEPRGAGCAARGG